MEQYHNWVLKRQATEHLVLKRDHQVLKRQVTEKNAKEQEAVMQLCKEQAGQAEALAMNELLRKEINDLQAEKQDQAVQAEAMAVNELLRKENADVQAENLHLSKSSTKQLLLGSLSGRRPWLVIRIHRSSRAYP